MRVWSLAQTMLDSRLPAPSSQLPAPSSQLPAPSSQLPAASSMRPAPCAQRLVQTTLDPRLSALGSRLLTLCQLDCFHSLVLTPYHLHLTHHSSLTSNPNSSHL